jgi:hypothetical protein
VSIDEEAYEEFSRDIMDSWLFAQDFLAYSEEFLEGPDISGYREESLLQAYLAMTELW